MVPLQPPNNSSKTFQFTATVFIYPSAAAAWYFVSVPSKDAVMIKNTVPKQRGFGSVPVYVEIDGLVFKTALFPNKYAKSYILPLKKAIREQLGIVVGDSISVSIRV